MLQANQVSLYIPEHTPSTFLVLAQGASPAHPRCSPNAFLDASTAHPECISEYITAALNTFLSAPIVHP